MVTITFQQTLLMVPLISKPPSGAVAITLIGPNQFMASSNAVPSGTAPFVGNALAFHTLSGKKFTVTYNFNRRFYFRYVHTTLSHLVYAIVHYTRIAIRGDRRDAFQAGKSPASMVTVSERIHT